MSVRTDAPAWSHMEPHGYPSCSYFTVDRQFDVTILRRKRTSTDCDRFTHDVTWYGPDFALQPDHGTTNVNVLAPDGAAVAITSTINYL